MMEIVPQNPNVKRCEDILVDSGEVNATGLLNQFKELHKSYVVSYNRSPYYKTGCMHAW